jgi:hypothetical protein
MREHLTARPAASYYVWEVPGAPVRISINLDVVDRLNKSAVEAFKSVPKRGVEVGGLLLGRIEDGDVPLVCIESFRAVACEHRRGPSYSLSAKDKEHLGHLLSKYPNRDQHVVGFFRSHTRLGLYLDEDDFSVVSQYFAGPEDVVLLVQPSASGPTVGGFFFWQEGDMDRRASKLQFPFDRERLEIGDHSVRPPQPVQQAPAVRPPQPIQQAPAVRPPQAIQQAPAVRPPAPVTIPQRRTAPAPALQRIPPPQPAPQRITPAQPSERVLPAGANWIPDSIPKWSIILAVAAVVVAAALFSLGRGSRAPEPQSMTQRATLSLNVERSKGGLRLSWDRNAPEIRNADSAVLMITDGETRKSIKLDSQQLTDGTLAYWPVTNDVNFRMDVFTGNQRLSESIRTIDDRFATESPIRPPESFSSVSARGGEERPSRPEVKAPETRSGADQTRSDRASAGGDVPLTPARSHAQSKKNKAPDQRASALPGSTTPGERTTRADSAPSETRSTPRPASGTAARSRPPEKPDEPPKVGNAARTESGSSTSRAVLKGSSHPGIMSEVTYEPAEESGLRRVISKIPLVRSLQKNSSKDGDRFVPAKPVRRVQPSVPAKLHRELDREIPIDVRVYIDESGIVWRKEIVASDVPDQRFVTLAMNAAEKWDFKPARLNDRNVSSEMILHFRFKNADQ